jgi:hypothetical protein
MSNMIANLLCCCYHADACADADADADADDILIQDATMALAVKVKAVKARENAVKARENAVKASVAKHAAEMAANKKAIEVREAECAEAKEAAKDAALAAAMEWQQLDDIVMHKNNRIADLERKLKSISLLLDPISPPWQGYAIMTTRPCKNLFEDD